jgi:hypothetical protein
MNDPLVFFVAGPVDDDLTATDVSALHGVVVEVQWREEILGHIDAGSWRES